MSDLCWRTHRPTGSVEIKALGVGAVVLNVELRTKNSAEPKPFDALKSRRVAVPADVATITGRFTARGRGQDAPRAPAIQRLSPLKRALDLMIAVPLLVFTAPLWIAIAVAIRMTDGGAAMFRQTRIGLGGRTFTCFKFRSMVTDADARLQELLQNDPQAAAEWAADQKLRDDPRITLIGRFLRKTSLDELPQLINIIRGDMSVVGPRPVVRDEIVRYGRYFADYASVRPGVTGLWQVSGRNDMSYERRVRLDAIYARRQSALFDIKILLATIPAVLKGDGAY